MVERSFAPTKTGREPATFVSPGPFDRVLLMSTPEPMTSGRKFGGAFGSAGMPATSTPVPLSLPREEKSAGTPSPRFSPAATEITHGAQEYGLMTLVPSPSLPAAKTIVTLRSCSVRVATLIG